MVGGPVNRVVAERRFTPDTSSIGAARRFARVSIGDAIDVVDDDLAGDVELAVSELVTNAVEYGLDEPVTVRVAADSSTLVVSVSSARTGVEIADPLTWSGPLPAVRTGRGLAIVRAVTDEVSVDVDEATVTVHCTFRLG